MWFPKRLTIYIALAIATFIILIEGIIFINSYHSRERDLLQMRQTIHAEIEKPHREDHDDIESHIIPDSEIKERLHDYAVNILLIVTLIIGVVVSGTVLIFHYLIGRHIMRVWQLNLVTDEKNIVLFPENEIPNNELGDNIRSRNFMVKRLYDYQNNLEKLLQGAKDDLIQKAKLSTIGELTAVISHDLRNPLTVVDASVRRLEEQIKSGDFDKEKAIYTIEKSRLAVDRIVRLVDQMNRYNRKQFSPVENVNLSQLLDNVLILLEGKLKYESVSIEKDFLAKCPTVWCDAIQIEQVFMNLLSNAVDAMKGKTAKRIFIDFVDLDDNAVTVSVEDTGHGITRAEREMVFKPFHSNKPAGMGTGLGLNICTQIMEKHGSRLILEDNPGKGAKFSLKFYKRAPGTIANAA